MVGNFSSCRRSLHQAVVEDHWDILIGLLSRDPALWKSHDALKKRWRTCFRFASHAEQRECGCRAGFSCSYGFGADKYLTCAFFPVKNIRIQEIQKYQLGADCIAMQSLCNLLLAEIAFLFSPTRGQDELHRTGKAGFLSVHNKMIKRTNWEIQFEFWIIHLQSNYITLVTVKNN